MSNQKRRRLAAVIGAGLILLFGAAFVAQNRFASNRAGEWVEVKKGDLVLGVEVNGQLEAQEAEGLGPPQIEDFWDFKISMIAPEGSEVKKGQPVLGFDTTELQRSLEREQAEADSARKEIEKKQADLRLSSRDQALKLAEAESRLRKAQLKLEGPADVFEGGLVERKKVEVDHDTATKEVAYRKHALSSLTQTATAEIQLLEAKLARATRKVTQIQENVRAMTVLAPRDGTVIYIVNRRNEKKKVGDATWRGERIIQIPDLNRLRGSGEVDENDAGRVSAGQKVTFRLDALPDEEISGRVSRVGSSVQRSQSKQTLKIMKVEITLDRVDASKMRPGMRFRGTLETERAAGVVLVPTDAIRITKEGPTVLVRGAVSNREQLIDIGRRNNEMVEVARGLEAGDRVMRRDEGEEEDKQ